MMSRDYTKEVGLSTGEKKIPLVIAISVLVAIAIGVWFGLAEVRAAAHRDKAADKVSVTNPSGGESVASR